MSTEESEYQSKSEGSDLSFLATDLAEQITETYRIVEEATRAGLSPEIEEQRNRTREEVSIESSEDEYLRMSDIKDVRIAGRTIVVSTK